MDNFLTELNATLEGELFFDNLHKTIYATDASVYREMPLAVAYPKNQKDIQKLIKFATKHKTTLIPRTAGTSLAGQCVGNGIVVDVSKYFTDILEFNEKGRWIIVQPGVIRDELNQYLKPYGLFFSPETSTANRAMIGGMVGNNSTGTNSIAFGNTRDHVLELEAILSDGSVVVFKDLDKSEFKGKLQLETLEGTLYKDIIASLEQKEVQNEIKNQFPKPAIHRRNTGYAVDELLNNNIFDNKQDKSFNFCKLICGSEGTLAFITKIKLNLLPLPPKENVLLCPHFKSVKEALLAVQNIMPLKPYSCELMDKIIIDCTKENKAFDKYRFFIEGEPEAVLMIELKAENTTALSKQIEQALEIINKQAAMYVCPQLKGNEISKAWYLRKAGLGLLANIPGDKKAVAVIEDTAVHIDDLANYIDEFTAMMEKHHQKAVYYAHAGAGELHLRPILNLKESNDIALFKEIAWDTARLVKKYKGSLSGEHGDGRVRASFLPFMLGEKNYQLLKDIKHTWDADNIFNAGKIIDAKPIDEDLRYEADRKEPKLATLLNFDAEGGILRLAEKCNGSGDCRKTHLSGGTMCPSYMATKNEKDTTRARANTLREFLTQNNSERQKWNSKEIKEALDLCLSCKACKSECPSNVDMALMKAEYTYQYNKINGTPFRSKLFGNVEKLSRLGSVAPSFTNWVNGLSITKKIMGLAQERTAPKIAKQTLRKWIYTNRVVDNSFQIADNKPTIYLFIDEFTNYNDVEIGKKTILLLQKLGYIIKIAPIFDSGRAYLSKGMLDEAKKIANKNAETLLPLINKENPIIGIEPSAILSFRDEYVRLVDDKNYKNSSVAKHSYTIEEFLAQEIKKGIINSNLFTEEHLQIKLHGHCHQKAISEQNYTKEMLSLPKNYHVEILPTGCCGMAGSFGYEKEHYEVSMKVGNLVLFPAVRAMEQQEVICAPGTSCRHQIHDGTQRTALHPVEVLYNALK
ncbi:MAG: FAD-linked oxidase C-terminal domain-containing protein [Chitinophagales bacterium]